MKICFLRSSTSKVKISGPVPGGTCLALTLPSWKANTLQQKTWDWTLLQVKIANFSQKVKMQCI
jgi:hypothetical protein